MGPIIKDKQQGPFHDKAKEMFFRKGIHSLVIILLGIIVYSNTLNSPFAFDDGSYIINNPIIRDFRCFTDTSLANDLMMKKSIRNLFRTRVVGHFTFALNYDQHHLDVTGYHVVNLLVHIINALLVYQLVALTLKTRGASGHINTQHSRIMALFAALLFVSHPVQTQAVTYITQRFTSLATMFYLLSLAMYIRCRDEKQEQKDRIKGSNVRMFLFYGASIASAVLAMKTKEISFTLPLIIAIYEFMFFKDSTKKRMLYLIPLLLTMLIIPLTLSGTKDSVAEISRINESASGGSNIARDYLYTQFRVIVTYIRLLFLPVNQNLDYDYPVYRTFFKPDVYLSFLFLVSVMWAGVYLWYRSVKKGADKTICLKLISFGILWFFVTLSVESSLIPLIDLIFEHRIYLPSVGFFMAVIGTVLFVVDKNRISLKAIIPVMGLIVIALSVVAYERNSVWQGAERLLQDNARKSPNKARPHLNLGDFYYKRGFVDKALFEFQTASKLNPDLAEAHNNIGLIYAGQGRVSDAIRECQTALRLNPDFSEAHNNMGNLYFNEGRINEALLEYETAAKLSPELAVTHNNLGVVYEKQGRFAEALQEYQAAIRLMPGFEVAQNNLEKLNEKTANKKTMSIDKH